MGEHYEELVCPKFQKHIHTLLLLYQNIFHQQDNYLEVFLHRQKTLHAYAHEHLLESPQPTHSDGGVRPDPEERGRLGIPNTSTFLVLELVESPQRRRVFTDTLVFELVCPARRPSA